MQITLMRHGHAHDFQGDDATRPLTEQGREAVDLVVGELLQRGWKAGAIVCSPLARSVETAERLRAQLPETPVYILYQAVATTPDLLARMAALGLNNPILIGHQPGLSRLAGELLAGMALPFRPAMALCVEVDGLPPTGPGRIVHHLDSARA